MLTGLLARLTDARDECCQHQQLAAAASVWHVERRRANPARRRTTAVAHACWNENFTLRRRSISALYVKRKCNNTKLRLHSLYSVWDATKESVARALSIGCVAVYQLMSAYTKMIRNVADFSIRLQICYETKKVIIAHYFWVGTFFDQSIDSWFDDWK